MPTSTDARRRWLGLVCLTVAAFMLLAGRTVLEPSLDGLGFLVYWLICFLATIASIVIALLDVRALRQQSRELRREILEDAFGDLTGPQAPQNNDSTAGNKRK